MDVDDRARLDAPRTRRTCGARAGDPAVACVLAHEHGHHVQGVLGQRERAARAPRQTGPQGGSTRLLEVQVGGLAGVRDADVAEGLSAAAVGEHRVQEAATGRVEPEACGTGRGAR